MFYGVLKKRAGKIEIISEKQFNALKKKYALQAIATYKNPKNYGLNDLTVFLEFVNKEIGKKA